MATYTYPNSSMRWDYLQAGSGLILTAAPVLLLELPPAVRLVLGSLAGLFLIFGWLTLRRHRSAIGISAEGIVLKPRGPRLRWDALTAVDLAYYSTRRDRRAGWMQLSLRAGRARLTIDSRLDGFAEVVRRAEAAARGGHLALDPATLMNLEALGLAPARKSGRPAPAGLAEAD